MKKVILTLSLLAFITLSTTSCSSDDNNDSVQMSTITAAELPVASTNFLSQYFNGETIRLAQKTEVAYNSNSVYKVYLNNGFEVDFDSNGNWTEIDSEAHIRIPDAFIEQELPLIYNYIQTNYPQNWVISIDKEYYGYSIELNNDVDLVFNSSQEFVGVDADNNTNETIINSTELPEAAKNFVANNFKGANYVLVKKEIEAAQTIYEVYLSTGYNLEFDVNGKWIKLESEWTNAQLPSALIPTTIQNYLTTNYPGYLVKKLEVEIYGYSVEVEKGQQDIELKFNTNGEFLGIDN